MNGAPGAGGDGDAAYGALSLFLVVAVNKARTEELIDTEIHTLHQEYCRIKMVNKTHSTDRMKEHTAAVYRLGIEFLYTATRYYLMSTYRRWWHHLMDISLNEVNPSVETYDDLWTKTFNMKHPALFDVEKRLYANECFGAWCETDELNLIILWGATDYPPQTDLSWLSPSATDVVRNVDKIFPKNPPLLLRHFCQLEYSCGGKQTSGDTVVKSLIFQLLGDHLSESLFRDNGKYAQVKHDIELIKEMEVDGPTEIIIKLFKVLENLLKSMEVEKVLIVIDRVDAIEEYLETFTNPLLRLMATDDCKVKVMLASGIRCSLDGSRIKRHLGAQGFKIMEINQGDLRGTHCATRDESMIREYWPVNSMRFGAEILHNWAGWVEEACLLVGKCYLMFLGDAWGTHLVISVVGKPSPAPGLSFSLCSRSSATVSFPTSPNERIYKDVVFGRLHRKV
ncbi:hypothetical protein BU23DRAFT_648299 [Bimuria novae-zelandiae CBS 107.79]|uniref:DUF7708 domain-containing protein n=1 Tax=Bimuria novae-zelandiae CBS 107.79 TaxID=1447943 RepID=A0A6A5VCJ8_9PLEO|nr:hypothetical protein BU23DRAFT_648299 [Bimuria novae-zelandiae CBS 107.79]